MAMPNSFAEIVELWNPYADLARACDVPTQNVLKWKDRDFIPAEFWSDVIAASRKLKPKPKLTEKHLVFLAKRRWR